MTRARAWTVAAAATCLAGPAWSASSSGYTYVRMSLTVPWTLYFVFLVCVLIPFVVMMVLAWRNASKPDPGPKDGPRDDPSGGAP
jgi:hypothetical protein